MSRTVGVGAFSRWRRSDRRHRALAIRNKPQRTDGGEEVSGRGQPRPSPRTWAGEGRTAGGKNPKLARREYAAALKDFQTAATRTGRLSRTQWRRVRAQKNSARRTRASVARARVVDRAVVLPRRFEYRAEADLGLNRLDEVKQAYRHLFVHDRAASNMLMKAMRAWGEARRMHLAAWTFDIARVRQVVRERDTLASSVWLCSTNSRIGSSR